MMCGVVHIGCPYVYAVLNSCVSSGGLSVLCVCVCMCIRMIGLPEPEGPR